jgi:methyl-accepting chemotaxis protein
MTKDNHEESRAEDFTVPEDDGVTSGVPFPSTNEDDDEGADRSRGGGAASGARKALAQGRGGSHRGQSLRTLGGMQLKHKLMLSFGLLTAVILIVGGIAMLTMRDIAVLGIDQITAHAGLARESDELRKTVALIHDEEKDFLLLEDAKAATEVERLSERVNVLLTTLTTISNDLAASANGADIRGVQDVREAADAYIDRFRAVIASVGEDRQALAALAAADADTRAALVAGMDAAVERFDALVADFWTRAQDELDDQTLAEGRLLERFARELAVAQAGLAAYVAGHRSNFPELARATFGEVLAQLDLLREQSGDPSLKRDLSEARKALLAHDVLLRQRVEQQAAAQQQQAALKQDISTQKDALRALGRNLSARAEALSSEAWSDLRRDSDTLTTLGNRAKWVIGVTASIGVLVGLLVLILIPRPIVAAIGQLVEGAQRIARGDLTTPVEVASRDELGLLGQSFEHMRTNLLELVRRIQRSAVQLSSSINEIQAAATEQAASSSQQAGAVNELSSSLNEMSQSASTLLSSAENVGHSVDEIAGIVSNGNAKSEQMMRSMDAIGVSTRQTAERIKSLSDRMDDIDEAVNTISGVADQTTLLSLNASIEANKAGEMGKGFSVVAHEIRRLSDRSIDSASNINAMVRDIQRATESSALAMDKSSEEIRHGVVLVGESAEALTQINAAMERIQEQMTMIVESVRAQAESSRMVQSTSTEMLSSANMVSKAASQTRSVTHDLSNMAAQLSAAVAVFET